MPNMTETELLSIVQSEVNQAKDPSEIFKEIAQGLDYYNGEPLGTEEEGSSSVISRDVKDIIEAMLPSLIRIFTSTDRAVEFLPFDVQDEEAAKQETDIVNYSFYKENNGFYTIYTWFKDALLSKNGIVKVTWDEKEVSTREEYEGLNELGLQQLLADKEVEPVEFTLNEDNTNDVVIRRTSKVGKAKVDVIPIEEFIISRDASSIFPNEARMTCHKADKTRSDLIAEGFDKKLVESIGITQEVHTEEISIARDNKTSDTFGDDAKDPSMKEIEVFECYIRVDFDGDGIAELRQVTYAGSEILVNEEIDENPFVVITPIMLTHKFYGNSISDDTMDIQLINSTLLRGVLNNMYLANNPRKYYQSGMVNLDDLLTSRSGGVVETLAPPSNVLMNEPVNTLPPQIFDVMGKMEQVRKERTGVGQEFFGLESNVLAHGKTGVVDQAFDAARMKIELIARIFAEIGMKPLFLKLHGLMQKHPNKERTIRLRGKEVPVNPNEWKTRENMTVNVGLGTGNKDKEITNLMNIIGIQKELLPGGKGITEKNVYDTLEKLVEASGFKDVSVFFTDPDTQQPPPPQPNFQEELLKLQQHIEAQNAQNDQTNAETKRLQTQLDSQARERELDLKEFDLALKQKDIDLKDERERTKMELESGEDVPGAAV